MRQELLKQLMWEDIQEIWYETDKTLHSELVKAMATASEKFSLALKNLHEKNECPPSIGVRFPSVMSAAERAMGRRLSKGRSKENTTFRAFVAYRLREEGYTFSDIGKMLQRDHSTVMHLCDIMRDMLSVPMAYQAEMAMYREFEELLCQPRQ